MPAARTIKIHKRTLSRTGGPPKTSYWQLRWTDPATPPVNGKRPESFEQLGWMTEAEAEEQRRQKEAKLLLGIPDPSCLPKQRSGASVLDALTDLLDDLIQRNVGMTGYIVNIKNRSIPLIAHLGDRLCTSITAQDLTQYAYQRREEIGGRRHNRKPKKSTVLDELRLIRRAIARAHKLGKTTASAPDIPRLQGWPDDHRPPRRLSLSEVSTMIQRAREEGRVDLARLIEFMAWCPRRPIAILALTRYDCRRVLDSQGGARHPEGDIWIARDKGQRERGWCPLTAAARRVLREHLLAHPGPADELVWKRPHGARWTNQSIRGALLRLGDRAGVISALPYDLRKFATVRVHLAARGQGHVTIRFSGHATTQMLEARYLYADSETIETAASADWKTNK